MALPGFKTMITLTREGMTSQAADGTPIVATTVIWNKRGHYQQMQGTFQGTDTGYVEYEVYRFWLPFLIGNDRPIQGDLLTADGIQFRFIGISQETYNHHLVIRAQRVER
jgi:hypothetical protein